MVYLNNDNNKQDVYIPRNDGQGSYVSPCDKCYQEGYKDGCEECGNVNLEDKSVVVTAATQTVLPSSGYDGMTSVDVDATEWGQSKYDEGHDDGYDEGYGNGEDDQKARLSSATFVENGEYTLENGWSAVTVQTTCPPCPEPSLENKTVELESGTTLPATITPSSGYDGFSKVTIEDNGYGDKKYDDGFSDGQDDIRNNMSSTAFTQNGNYSNSSGWSAVTVNVPTSGGSNLQNKSVVLTAGTQTVLPDTGYDGMTEVDIDATDLLNDEHTNAFSDGYSQGVDDVRSHFTTTAVTQNGTYQMTGEFNAFSSFTVNVSASCNTVSDFKTIVTGTDETVCVGFYRPSAPSGETVYGGSYEQLKWFMDNYGNITIFSFTDQAHSDEIEQGYFAHRNDQYIYYNFQAGISFPLDEIGPSWTNTGNNDKFFLWNDGMNIFFYTRYEYGWETNYVILPPESLILELADGDAAECIHIDSSKVYQDGYDDAWAVAMESGHTVGLQEMSCIKYVSDNEAVIAVDDYLFNTRTANVQATGDSVTIATNANVTTYRTITAQLNSPPPVSAYCYGQIDVDNRVGQIIRFNFDPNEKSHVTEVWLPETLMLMSQGIFQMYECFGSMDNLEYVHFPSALKNIVGFNSCPKLDNVVLPRRLAFITNAFNQTDIHEIEFPQTVGTIRDNVLRCSSIEKVIIRECCYIGYGFCSAESYSGFTGTDKAANLKEIYCYSTVAPIFRVDERNIELTDPNLPFANQLPNGTLYVPTGYASAYASWLDFLPSGWTISATL